MRKIRLMLSMLFTCVIISGCSASDITPLSELYQDKITFGGVSYSVPFTVGEFSQNYRITKFEGLENHYNFYNKNDLYGVIICEENDSIELEDRMITDIIFLYGSRYSIGGVYPGATKESIERLHGKPNNTTSSDDDAPFSSVINFSCSFYYMNDDVTLQVEYINDAVNIISYNFNGTVR